MSSLDLNDTNSLQQSSVATLLNDNSVIDRDHLEEISTEIKNQYINFNNLGTDLLKEIENEYLILIYQDMLEYINENYISIINFDDVMISSNKTLEVGKLVYQFLCIDMYNTLLPNWLSENKIVNSQQLDLYFKNTLNNDISNFKTSFIKTINNIVDQLLKLNKLDKYVTKDSNYNELLKRYGYYLELINFGESSNFLFEVVKPIFLKNYEDIIWRMT